MQLGPCSSDGHSDDSFHLTIKFIFFNVFRKIGDGQYIALLELTIVSCMLLDCVVGEMREET
jgi:hypothetical protein